MEHLPRNRYTHKRNSLRSILHNDRKMTNGNLKDSYLPLPPSSKWCPFLASNRKHRRCMSMIALSTNAFVKLPAAFFNRRMYSPLVSRLFFGNFFSQRRMTRVTLELKLLWQHVSHMCCRTRCAKHDGQVWKEDFVYGWRNHLGNTCALCATPCPPRQCCQCV